MNARITLITFTPMDRPTIYKTSLSGVLSHDYLEYELGNRAGGVCQQI